MTQLGYFCWFSGKARDILLRQSRLAQFWQHFCAKALLLVIPTELEIFWQHFCAKALLLVIPTELEMFLQHFCAKALFLVIPTELEIASQYFCAKALLLVIPAELEMFLQDLYAQKSLLVCWKVAWRFGREAFVSAWSPCMVIMRRDFLIANNAAILWVFTLLLLYLKKKHGCYWYLGAFSWIILDSSSIWILLFYIKLC